MCGICGIFNYLKKPINSKSIVEKIVKIQHRRGPDDQGIWESKCKRICFGHNRLTIIDLSEKGKQPFISADGKYVINFNGEIYNFKEIKKELTEKNIIFKSNTDTEVILESYKFWGLDFVSKLRGMFAFAIWDDVQKKLILARDPFGIKPLYYSKKNGIYYFASQVKSLLSIEDVNSNYLEAGIVSYYLWGNIQEPYTLYKDIKSLKKGSCLIINNDGDEKIYTYADIKETILNSNSLNLKNDEEKQAYLKSIVNETVNYHQVSDVPLTISLSSGIDSNVILSLINEKNKKNCSAITMDFEYKGSKNEVPLAKQSTLMNKIPHYVEKISENELFSLLENFFNDMDLPTNDGLNNYLISYLAKKNNSKIIVSGVGGDEMFFGYPSFNLIPKITKLINFFPKSDLANNFFRKIIHPLLKKNLLKTKYAGIYEYGRDINLAFLLIRSLFIPFETEDLIAPDVFKVGFKELDIFNNCKKDIEEISDVRLAIMYLEIKYYLCSKLLKDADWTSMSHSVELRTPFVDWFFFNKLIPLLKSDNHINKKSLLNCAKDKVPKELFTRKKTGFGIPYKNYFKKLSIKKKFNNPIRDWSIFSYTKYVDQ